MTRGEDTVAFVFSWDFSKEVRTLQFLISYNFQKGNYNVVNSPKQ